MRFFIAAAAMLIAAPALAQSGYYAAKPAVAPTKATFVTRSTVWKCTDGACSAGRGDERDAVLCELVAQRVGKLDGFTVGGAAFAPDALAKCNSRVK